jgi:spore germination protein YaaH
MRRVLFANLAATVGMALAAAAMNGCGTEGPEVIHFGSEQTSAMPRREGTVIMEGCVLDTWQVSQLDSAAAKNVFHTVILLCPSMRASGEVAPTDPDARAALAHQVAVIRAHGYRVELGVALSDDIDAPLSQTRDDELFANPTWRQQVIKGLADFAPMADGIDIDLQHVPASIRSNLSQFFAELAPTIHNAGPSSIGVFAPPSQTDPSDIPGADAYDLSAIAVNVDRVRLMTLDYSCCGGAPPGPTLDTGWAVDVLRLAQGKIGGKPVDLAVPLFGTDFSELGQRSVTYLEAMAIANAVKAQVIREPSGALHYQWNDEANRAHETWFDDGVSTARTLHAWSTDVVPESVGIVFYGFGAEDPALWDTVSRGMR